MCFAYTLRTKIEKLDLPFKLISTENNISFKVHPYGKGLVILNETDGNHKMEWMQYSLIPAWSDQKKLKFTTYNARSESIETKPTWKNSFKFKRCLVPLTHFTESVYEGPLAGNIVNFAATTDSPLMSAGLWEEWIDKSTGELIRSYAIVTKEPYDFVRKNGHDRSPFFIQKKFYEQWLDPKWNQVPEIKMQLIENTYVPELTVSVERPLKPGWSDRK
jgi:putative SOS response-associated peptidase YedK